MRIVEPLCAVFRRTLKRVGQKYTPERAAILDMVIAMPGTFDAEGLVAALLAARSAAADGGGGAHQVLASLRISKATVYRTLKLLADAGIVQQVLVNSEQAHYQLAYGRGPVATLVNTATGLTEQVELPALEELAIALCASRNLSLTAHRFIVYAEPLPTLG